MKKVLVLRGMADGFERRIIAAAGQEYEAIFENADWDRNTSLEALKEAEVILGEPEPKDLKFCEKLKFLQTSWAGVDHYIATGLFNQDRILCNGSGGYGIAIAEYMVGTILAQCHYLPTYQRMQMEGGWDRHRQHKTLEGSTILILGAGDIGTELAKRLAPFQCKIVGVRRTVKVCPEEYDDMITLEQLDQWLPQADVVACCLPNTPLTQGLFTTQRLLMMKKDAIFVNVGRGTLVSCDDLAKVMECGHLWGAVIDVTVPEPLPAEHPLRKLENVILTPHVSGYCVSDNSPTKKRLSEIMVSNFEKYVQGKPLDNIVDCTTGYRKR